MVLANVVAADTDAEAERLFTSVQQQFINLRRGTPGQLPPPVDPDSIADLVELSGVSQALRYAVVGSPETVKRGLTRFIEQTQPDEIMTTAHIFDYPARLHSFDLAAQALKTIEVREKREEVFSF
jgi:alkanesulfonate monooxygenase SsuD/methylene tetrahydromethanopterin reductase-like flavin-dependent oxidoreductase (luciferase family)